MNLGALSTALPLGGDPSGGDRGSGLDGNELLAAVL